MLDFGLLCPAPQRAQLTGGTLRLARPLRIVLAGDAQQLYPLLAGVLKALVDAIPGSRTAGEWRVSLGELDIRPAFALAETLRSPQQAQSLRSFGLEQKHHVCRPTRRANAPKWKKFVLNEGWFL